MRAASAFHLSRVHARRFFERSRRFRGKRRGTRRDRERSVDICARHRARPMEEFAAGEILKRVCSGVVCAPPRRRLPKHRGFSTGIRVPVLASMLFNGSSRGSLFCHSLLISLTTRDPFHADLCSLLITGTRDSCRPCGLGVRCFYSTYGEKVLESGQRTSLVRIRISFKFEQRKEIDWCIAYYKSC